MPVVLEICTESTEEDLTDGCGPVPCIDCTKRRDDGRGHIPDFDGKSLDLGGGQLPIVVLAAKESELNELSGNNGMSESGRPSGQL